MVHSEKFSYPKHSVLRFQEKQIFGNALSLWYSLPSKREDKQLLRKIKQNGN